MSPEELDEARAKEAKRLWGSKNWSPGDVSAVTKIAARLARENWTPPEPEPEVDPDLLAFRKWYAAGTSREHREHILAGVWDQAEAAVGFLAGARMATERERERSKVLVKYVEIDTRSRGGFGEHARATLAEYRGEA